MWSNEETLNRLLLFLYLAAITINCLYSIARWLNLLRAVLRKNVLNDEVGSSSTTIEPTVTVQIYVDNNVKVIEDTIRCARQMEWPRDKLFIQILDDSTDPTAIEVVRRAVSEAVATANIERRTRQDRVGDKAGSFAHHFPDIKGDFVAYFNADHRPDPDFLRRAIPRFYDENGQQKLDVGFVQAPWAYYNMHQNTLTESDAISLDVRQIFEQAGRVAGLGVLGFSGSGGVWRKKAIVDAGGWNWMFATEELALSYMAHLKGGYKFAYISDPPQELESPAGIVEQVKQKHRLAKGSLQVCRELYWHILFSSKIPTAVKVDAFVHMTASFQNVVLVGMLCLYPLLRMKNFDSQFIILVSLFPFVDPVIAAILAIFGKTCPGDDGKLAARFQRLLYVLPSQGLRYGMALFEVRAMLEGIACWDKMGAMKKRDGQEQKSYVGGTVFDRVAAGLGTCLAFYLLAMATQAFEVRSGSVLSVCFLFVLVGSALGLLWVNGAFLFATVDNKGLHESYGGRGRRCGLVVLGVVAFWSLRTFALFPHEVSHENHFRGDDVGSVWSDATFTLPKRAIFPFQGQGGCLTQELGAVPAPQGPADSDEWVCPLANHTDVTLHPHMPTIIFTHPRSGSSFLMSILRSFTQWNLPVLTLEELFRPDSEMAQTEDMIHRIATALRKECDGGVRGNANNWRTQMQQLFELRRTDPVGFVRYLQRVPSRETNPSVVFKVFGYHLGEMEISPGDFIDSVIEATGGNVRFIVMWRRRIVENYVSFEIAKRTSKWMHVTTGKDDAIQANQDDLKWQVDYQHEYYQAVRDKLDEVKGKVDVKVLQYEEDMITTEAQDASTQGLIDFLGFSEALNVTVIRDNLPHMILKKQAQVPVEQQVSNWDDVVKWGYGDTYDKWKDIFEGF